MRLKHYCVEYLEKNLDASNCLTVKSLAEKYQYPKLFSKASDYFEKHIETVLSQNLDLLALSFNEVSLLLSKYKSSIQEDTFLR